MTISSGSPARLLHPPDRPNPPFVSHE
jgi:hypothetical protein